MRNLIIWLFVTAGLNLIALEARSEDVTTPPAVDAVSIEAEVDMLYHQSKRLYEQSRFAEAEPMAEKALAKAETLTDPDSIGLNGMREDLAHMKMARGRYAEATKLLKKNIEIYIRENGQYEKFLIYMYPGLIASLIGEQKYSEAEEMTRFLLEFEERVYGNAFLIMPPAVDRLFSLSAQILEIQGRLVEAEAQYKRILSTYELFNQMTKKESGDWEEASFLLRFAQFLERRKKRHEAGELIDKAASIAEKLGRDDSVDAAYIYDAKAKLLLAEGEFRQAEGSLNRSLSLRKKFLHPDHPEFVSLYSDMATVAAEFGQNDKAARYYRKAIDILGKIYQADNRETAALFAKMGSLSLRTGRIDEAKGYFERAAQINLKEIDTALLPAEAGTTVTDIGKVIGTLYDFDGLIKVNYIDHREASAPDMFALSQWARASETASALGQMSLRQEAGATRLSAVMRERQDLIRERQALDGKLIELVSLPYVQRKEANEKQIRKEIAAVAGKIDVADGALDRSFPSYAALANPRPLTIADVQKLLKEDEVLLSFVETAALPPLPAETFLWAVPKRGKPLWVKLPLAPDSIGAKVSALRDLLGVGSGARAATPVSESGSFDLAMAHELYRALLEPVASVIAGKQLIIVPSKNLSGLPFQLLASRAPDTTLKGGELYQRAQWLIRDHAISMLPAISSLKALRAEAQVAQNEKAYIGFGNPLLLGANGTDHAAWQVQGCPPANEDRWLIAAAAPRFNDRSLSQFFRGNRADIAEVRKLAPLPETVAELCAVAHSLKGNERDLYLGADATETKLKDLSESGDLASARIIHFATHGLVAGDLNFLAEPALVLTPPDDPTEADDGLLTASEVSTLKLNADWVILSACNTAAGNENNAEALSGLARAFFYAGTRGLLVSHWPVYSDAAVEITTGSINRLAADPRVGRAEALRQTLIMLIDRGGRYAMPAYWAPFVIVGEGS